MSDLVKRLRLHIGRALVGFGFWVAPDAYWAAFEGAIRSAKLREGGEDD